LISRDSSGQAVVTATEAEHVPGARETGVELLFVDDGAVALEAAA